MITGNQDLLYVILAYLGVGVVTLALIGLVLWQSRRVQRRIEALEKQGIRRRSAPTVRSTTSP